MASAQELIGGYWGVNPSPVIEDYAGAWTFLSGPFSGALSGNPPVAWTIRKDQGISPGPDGRPTTGYPSPSGSPVWIATSLVGSPVLVLGVDFTIEDDYIWFNSDPLFDVDGYLVWDSEFIQAADIWFGETVEPTSGTSPLPATRFALSQAIALACDSPATGRGRETVEAIWEAPDGSWRVITDAGAYRLVEADVPSVEVDDVLPPGTPLGSSWVLDRLGPSTSSDYVTSPAGFQQDVTVGDITWYAETTPLVIDTVDDRTRVRFRIGGDSVDVDAVWSASQSRGIANGRTLAQALDTRANPVGDPGPESLPTVISPMEFFCRELAAGCIYRLVVFPDKFGPEALTISQLRESVRSAAGSYAAVFIWEDEEPALTPVDPV